MTLFEKREPTTTGSRPSSQLVAPPSPDLLSWASWALRFKLSALLDAHCPLDLSSGASAERTGCISTRSGHRPPCVPSAAVAASSVRRDPEPCEGCRSGPLLFGQPPHRHCHATQRAEAQAQTQAEAELHPWSRRIRSTATGLARAVEVAEARMNPTPWAEGEKGAEAKDAAAEDAAAGDAAAAEVPKSRLRTASRDTLHGLS